MFAEAGLYIGTEVPLFCMSMPGGYVSYHESLSFKRAFRMETPLSVFLEARKHYKF
jgi:hypothetical protein